VFGDSYSDIGEGYLDGNGPTAVAYLARQLEIKLLPVTSHPTANASLDFAISGAGTGNGRGVSIEGAFLGRGMRRQADEFREMANKKMVQFAPERTLIFVAGGLNDDNLRSTVTVRNLKYVIRTLYKAGARNFALALLPVEIPQFSSVGIRLNPVLAQIPSQLLPLLPGAHITLSKWGPYFDDVMLHAAQYGISDTSGPCAGRAIFHQDPTPCKNPDGHFFYHEGHPSTAVHRIVGKLLYRELEAQCSDRSSSER
jgi:phospholipase/lecithinase/hemolysin